MGTLEITSPRTYFFTRTVSNWLLILACVQVGTDLSTIKPETVAILTNKEILAIHQDDVVGTPISPFKWGVNVS